MIDSPIQKRSKSISPIWTLPITAILLCCWLLYKSYLNAGIEVTIYFEDASGITAGKTQVMSMGYPIGTVKEMYSELDNRRVKTIVTMNRDVEKFLVNDTIFWVVRPEISASRIVGLETILSGSYIGVQAGRSSKKRIIFKGKQTPPPLSDSYPGLHIILNAPALNSVQEGSGIYYKNILIGSVQSYQLLGDNDNVSIRIHINEKFAHLVKPKSQFINISGISMSGNLTNIKLHLESLASIINGGILLKTPEGEISGEGVENGHFFTLFQDFEEANFDIPMTLELASGEDIVEGVTKVRYRGIEAGFVKSISINEDERRSVTATILLDSGAELILKEDTVFWLAKPQVSAEGISNLSTLVSGPYITFRPGQGEFSDHFKLAPKPPALKPFRPGNSYLLQSKNPVVAEIGSGVMFKNISVGEVTDIHLDQKTGTIDTEIYVYEQYLNLLSPNSIFYNVSGIQFDASIKDGIKVTTSPLMTIIKGGVSFTTPELERGKPVSEVEEQHRFPLYSSKSEAQDLNPQMKPKGRYFKVLSDSMGSLSKGSPVLYKKIPVGEVLGHKIVDEGVLISCFVQSQYAQYLTNTSRFYNLSGIEVKASLEGLAINTGSLETIIAGGVGLYNPLPSSGKSKNKLKKHYPLYPSLEEAKTADQLHLTIQLAHGEVKVNSPIKYLGVTIGKIHNLTIGDDLHHVVADVRIQKDYLDYFRTNTEFWVVKSDISLKGVKNLETIVFGPYLSFRPGAGKLTDTFTALQQPPDTSPILSHGLNLVLESKTLGSLSLDAPVYYRRLIIGTITGFELDPTYQKVLINVNIQDKYAAVVRSSTKFWNISGATIEGGVFSGITVKTDSMESIIRGGIALATQSPKGEKVANGHRFTLHDEVKDEWLDWNPNLIEIDQEAAPKSIGEK